MMSNCRNDKTEQFAEMFKALSSPHRLSIFLRLVSCCKPGTVCTTDTDARGCVGELGKDLGIAASTVSHHIKELRQAGLIRIERRGKNIDCWVEPETVRALADFFGRSLSD